MKWRGVKGLGEWAARVVCVSIVILSSLCVRGVSAQPASIPDEIAELARALKNDPDLIYEYVYNNIDTLPQYGSLKGAYGALLDGKGTAFDQAELMVALLQQAGFTASFQTGQIQLTTSQLANWLGVDSSCGSVGSTIGSGGFPGGVLPAPCNSVATAGQLGWVWVKVNIGGVDYVFDPSTKTYNRSTGIGAASIASALGYTQSTFLSRARTGATITSTSLAGLNRANIRSDLAGYANALVQHIRANIPAAGTADIIGGRAIIPLPLGTQLRQTSLSYSVGASTNHATIPSQFRTILTLTFGYNTPGFNALSSAITFNTSDIYGRRLVASLDSSARPSLLIDGVTQITGTGSVPSGNQLTIRASISHPYPSTAFNVTNSDAMKVSGAPNAIFKIVNAWGQVGRGMIEKHRKLLQENIEQNPGNPTAEPVLGEGFAMLGFTWLAEVSQQQQLVDTLGGTTTALHHWVGIAGARAVGASSGPYVDLPLGQVSVIQRADRPTTDPITPIESAAFFSAGIFASIAESGSIEQTQPGATAVSTVKLIDSVLVSGGQIFDINNHNTGGSQAFYTSSIRPTLATTYSSGDLSRLDNLVNTQNLRVIAPANGAINVMQYTGAGYFQIAQDGTSMGAIITGGLSGGIPATAVPPIQFIDNTTFSSAPSFTQTSVVTNPQGSSGNAGGFAGATQITSEPINLVTGDYLLNTKDLAVGSQAMPLGLAFQRYYDSGTRLRKGTLGNGWTHNFAITAKTDSDAFEGLGVNSPINGAATIAATFVTLDILGSGNGINTLDINVIGSAVQAWLMELLTTNIVAITQPGFVEHFTKLADGSYNPPLGSATTLSLNAGAFTYVAKDRTTLSFDSSGNLATLTTPSGASLTLTYSGSPATLSSISNNLGRTLTLSYSSSLLTQVSDGTGRSVSYGYDPSGTNLTTFVDTLGQTTSYVYDLPGRLTQIFNPATPGTAFVTNSYDSLGRVQTQANANGAAWQYFFAGSRSEEIDALGMRHVIYTTPRGKTRAEIQDLGGLNRVTTNTFDSLDRLTSTTAPEGNSVSQTYDAKSNVLTTTTVAKPGSPLAQRTTIFTYDPIFNKPTSITDPRAITTTFSYDGATGNLLSTVADFGSSPRFNATTRFTYNNVGQVLTTTDPLGVVTRFAYDSFGNAISVTRDAGGNGLNQVTTSTYTPVGDVATVTNPNGNVTATTYDAARRPVTVTSPPTQAAPAGVVTTLTYDPEGRVVQTRQSASGAVLRTASATYTLTGKPATVTDANGNVSRTEYDLNDRPVRVTDAAGRVTTFVYDPLGRRTQVLNTAIQATPLLAQSYTANGQLQSLSDANNNTTNFAYDGFDRLSLATYPGGTTEGFSYDDDNNVLTRKTRANQTLVFTYDTLNRLATKAPPLPAPVVSYSYDLAGRLTGVSDSSAAIAAAAPPTGTRVDYATTYTYDAFNRPLSVAFDPAPAVALPSTGANFTVTHTYNAVNQRTGQTTTDNSWWLYPAASPSTVNYTANALNQYTAVGAATPTYDGNGNLTSDGTFTFAYDAENRLTSASGAGNTATYAYDAQGRRKAKTVNGTTTIFVTDTDNREVMEYSGATGQILRWYAYGLGPNDALGQVDVAANSRATFIPDMLGSVIGIIDGQGALTKIGYAPFGVSSAAIAAPLRFTGQRRDAETGGLHYYRARMYAPSWGRFMQVDPIGYQGGVNLYAYVGNDPLNLVDPEGFVAEGFRAGLGASFSSDLGSLTDVADIFATGSNAARLGAATGLLTGNAIGKVAEIALFAAGGAVLKSTLGIGAAASFARNSGVLESANFAQRTFNQTFSSGGAFAGRTVDDVAAALRSGQMRASDVPIQYIVRDGNTLILNTRSAQALQQAGVPRASLNAVNMTGDAAAELRLTGQLQRNGLTNQGISTVAPGR